MKKKVVVGLSGGVDSAVAAAVLLDKGYEVIGVTMKVVPDKVENNTCCSLEDVEDARMVAFKLGIPFYVLNFQKIFNESVIKYFVREYLEGKTPNPCIACNKYVKFDALLEKARALGADFVATGHYAKIEFDAKLGRYLLKRSVSQKKDQTYVLYNLTQRQLKHILMPLGDMDKDDTRKIAKSLNLDVADKKDSQEICFVDNNDYASFILKNTDKSIPEGNFVDTKGNVLGKHRGIIHYTIGQRKGLGIALGKPMYVVAIDPVKNEVVLGEDGEQYRKELIADDVNFIAFEKLDKRMEVTAKIRYSAKEAEAVIFPLNDEKVKVVFKTPQRAVTPGQAIVFYSGDVVVGGGRIKTGL